MIFEVDAAYLQLDDSKIIDSKEVEPGVIFDLNLAWWRSLGVSGFGLSALS